MTITRTITVAAGVFAPGHLGELTWQVPFELADAVVEETRTRERRLRDLPSRVGVCLVVGLALFRGRGYGGVRQKMTAALGGQLGVPSPSPKALRDLRRRLGAAPVKALFEVLAGPAAQPSAPGVRFGRYRTVAFDGCTSIKVPDTLRNRGWLGKMKAALGVTGYPAVELMTLVETGTRALIGAVFGPPATGETGYAGRLVHLLAPDMLVLTDRGFDAAGFLEAAVPTPAQPPPLQRCRADPPVSRALGTRGRLPGATAHPAGRAGAALGRPGRPGTGNLGIAGPVPGAAPRHGHRRRDRPGHRPRPGQLHHRPANRHRHRDRSRRRARQRCPRPRAPWPRRPGRPAPAPPAPRQRPQGQITAIPLEQGRPAPASAQHTGDHDGNHRLRP